MEHYVLALVIIISSSSLLSVSSQMTYAKCIDEGVTPEPTEECRVRETLVKLDLPNSSYYHIVPDHVTVQRCGGSCHFERQKSCIPTKRGGRNKTVHVWLYPATAISGVVDAECATIEIEEHTECQCGCAKTAESCRFDQQFEEAQCACICLDQEAKAECYSRSGWFWDEDSCQCMCQPPNHPPHQCATGFQFDPINTCACVPMSEYASPVLLITVIILVMGIIVSGVGLLHCHRKNIGFFSHRRREMMLESIRSNNGKRQNTEQPLMHTNSNPIIVSSSKGANLPRL